MGMDAALRGGNGEQCDFQAGEKSGTSLWNETNGNSQWRIANENQETGPFIYRDWTLDRADEFKSMELVNGC